MSGWANNRTLQILTAAEKGGYGVIAQTCYDAHSVIGLVRAAERNNSPAILQLFPVTLAYGGGPFLQFCLNAAHGAKVPISVHLDHATSTEQLELAVGLAEQGIAFDSIMVDASHADTDEENIAEAKPWVDRARKAGVAVEVELGRLEGGEAGHRCHHPCPSIGNLHGSYINPPNFKTDILRDLRKTFQGRGIPICLHGTDELPDDLFRECVKAGVSKFNVNSWARDPYVKKLAAGLQDKPFPDAVEEATEEFAKAVERFIILFESAGKA
ncbi:aldolase [Hymenopellis radicata]|nr:aldolase [Hymenopellis radicata]